MHTTSDFESGCCESTASVQTGAGKREGGPSPTSLKNYKNHMSTYLETSTTDRKIEGFTSVTAANVAKYHDQIYKALKGSDKLKVNSIKSHLEALHYYLSQIPKYEKIAKKYVLEATQINKQVTIEKGENRFVGKRAENKDRIPTLPDLEEQFGKLYSKIDKLSVADHMKCVMLAVSGVLMPPMRGDTGNIKLIDYKDLKKELKDAREKKIIDPSNSVNFLVNRRGQLGTPNKYYFYMWDYKTVASSKEPTKTDDKEKTPVLEISLNDDMIEFYTKSLNILPRTYLICALKNTSEPILYQSWRKMAIKILNKDNESLGGQADLFRQIYVSHRFAEEDITLNTKKDIARLMMTSVAELEGSYKVILPSVTEKVVKPLKMKVPRNEPVLEEIDNTDTRDEVLAKRLANRLEKNKIKSNLYYENNVDKMRQLNKVNYQKNKERLARQRVIDQVKGERVLGIQVTRQSTLEKYAITEEDLK